MSATTNKLVGRTARIGSISAVVVALVLTGTFFLHHNNVHAAGISSPAPLDDSNVSSLVALDHAVEAVAARVTPAVVNVAVTSKESPDSATMQQQSQQGQDLPPGFSQFFGPNGPFGQQGRPSKPQIEHGIGSGVIISPDGYIVTNNHVVNGAVRSRVTLNDRRVLTAKLVGVDKLTDLAVIKVDANNLPSIAWGDSTALKPGQTVLAFGSPFGYFQFSVTRGIISALNRPNPYSNNPRSPGGFIQTDAAINPGNSGGPLVNAHGELIGINTFIISNSGSFAGAGFAIPTQIARNIAESIIKTGTVHHGYLGISMKTSRLITPASSTCRMPPAPSSPRSHRTPRKPRRPQARRCPPPVEWRNHGQRQRPAGRRQPTSPGTEITLGILRNGTPQTIHLKVGEFNDSSQTASNGDAGSSQGAKIGISVGDLTSDIRQQFNIPPQVQGVVVQGVRSGSPAEDAGIAPGDVILEVNRQPVTSADKFVSDVHANPTGKDLLLLVWSQGNASFRVVHPETGTQDGM